MKPRKFLNLREVLSVVPNGADRHAIRNFNFMNSEQPASVGRLAHNLGFEVRFEEMSKALSARLEPDTWSAKGWEIVVNSRHNKLRQRFSTLHEIAHYYLHKPAVDFLAPAKHRASGRTFDKVYSVSEWAEENEANTWSDAIVFGDGALEGAVGLHGQDLDRLSLHFGFSRHVVEKALQRRGLI